jgi:hypothetical protein
MKKTDAWRSSMTTPRLKGNGSRFKFVPVKVFDPSFLSHNSNNK